MALTFDDGPHPRGTPAILDRLAEYSASATFFLVGEQVRRDPGLAREVVARGHRVGLHCDRHRNMLRLTAKQIQEDLAQAEHALESIGAGQIELHRPPYGIHSWPSLAAVRARGWSSVLWSQAGRDWRATATPASIARDATRGLGAGSVVLLHDADHYSADGSWQRTLQALGPIVESIRAAGLEPGPLTTATASGRRADARLGVALGGLDQ